MSSPNVGAVASAANKQLLPTALGDFGSGARAARAAAELRTLGGIPSPTREDSLVRVYCEHGAQSTWLQEMRRAGRIELIHFPYDPDSRSKNLMMPELPSGAQIQDLHVPICDLPGTIADYVGSQFLEAILVLLDRRDALHMDTAVKNHCRAFITRDSGITQHAAQLEELLGIRVVDADRDREAFTRFIEQASPNGAAGSDAQ
jgi:hypothetical protein